MNKQEIILGWDNGNGTSAASAEVGKGGKVYKSFFPSVYAIGSIGQSIDRANGPKKLDKSLNGNASVFSTIVGDTVVWGGQTAYTVKGNPIDLYGFSRYNDTNFMKFIYYLTLQGLVNDGMPLLANKNLINMTVGMPPKIFYERETEREKIKEAFKMLLVPDGKTPSASMVYNDKKIDFVVRDLTFTAEGTGGYYDAIIGDGLDLTDQAAGYANEGVLVIDIGRYTFDAFILLDNQLGEEDVYTSPDYGLERLFQIINEEVGGTDVSTSEIERQNYNGSSRIGRLRNDEYAKVYSRSLDRYISSLSTPLSYFRELYDSFRHVIVMGGVSELFDDNRVLESVFSINGYPVNVMGAMTNAQGYRKFAKIVRYGG